MARLTSKELPGIWAGVTMSWNEDFSFDEKNYRINTECMCRSGAAGIYTTGSTGEFYALDFGEFKAMVDIQDEICRKFSKPLQIGCCSDNTRYTIKLMEYAASKSGVGAAQVNIPYWMELTDKELLQFFKDISSALPDMPIVHYNIPRAKRFLTGDDYLRILEITPNLIGVKYTFAGTNFGALQDALIKTPQLGYFVAENLLVSAMMLGAVGSCSSIIATDPAYVLKMYDLAKAGKWDEAIPMQKNIHTFFNELEELTDSLGEGGIDPVADKGLGVAAGCIKGHQRTRAPYIGWSDDTVKAVREFLVTKYPEFVYPE